MEARNPRRDLIRELEVEYLIRNALGALDRVAEVAPVGRVATHVTDAELSLREALGYLLSDSE